MSVVQVAIIAMLAAPVIVLVSLFSEDSLRCRQRPSNDELAMIGFVTLWNAAIALLLLLGGFW